MGPEGSLLHSQVPATCPYPEPWYVFTVRSCKHLAQTPSWRITLCRLPPRLLIQYIRSYPPYAWRALHFVMRIVKKGNKNTKSLVYTSLVLPILEYGAACWDPYRECQISALDRVKNKAAKFAHHSGGSDWESVAQRRKIARMCALYKAYTGERAWKAIGDRLQAPSYWSRVDHRWKIRARKQRTDIGKYSFVNRSITDWSQLPEGATGTSHSKTHIFKTRVRKV